MALEPLKRYIRLNCHVSRLQHADRMSAKRVIIIGTTEWERGCVRVKDMKKREEVDVPIAELCQSNNGIGGITQAE